MRGVVALAVLVVGCNGEGDYEVDWTIGAAPAEDGCAPSGLDTVVLDWVRGEADVLDGSAGTVTCTGEVIQSTEHACRAGKAKGFIDAGTYDLCVEALSPERSRFTGVVVASGVPVREGDLVVVTLALPVVPQCRNGLDDEPDRGDGRIDDLDPQCSDDLDAAE